MPRSRQLIYYGLPMLFCVALHEIALRTWFFQDDFAWLALRLDIGSPADILPALFSPKAEGTIRTLSERLYFLILPSLFGLDIVPFKIVTFLTQLANIALLIQITRRITGSQAAGFLAAILWIANAGLALALGWSSAYNEIAFAFVILLAFRLFLQYIETGQRKYWIWQWIVFLLGFLVLELNVAYPVLALGYALCCARRYFRQTLFLFIPSILFAGIHLALIPAASDPSYEMHFGSAPLVMLWTYWSYALGALRDLQTDWRPHWLGVVTTIAISIALGCFLAVKVRRRDLRPLFLVAWFLVMIAPILPLRNHFTEYYILVPSLGLAIMGGWALSEARGFTTLIAGLLAASYLAVSIGDIHMTEKFFYDRARRMKYLVQGLARLPKPEMQKAVLLDGVDNEFFWSGITNDPFRLLGISRCYLTPGTEATIDAHPEWGGISRWIISSGDAVSLLSKNDALVFRLQGKQLRDVTSRYFQAAQFAHDHPEFVAVADPLYRTRLGPTWYRSEQDFRWMPKSATVQIAGPRASGQILEITGYCPATVLAEGPLEVSFRADGIEIGTASLNHPDQAFDLKFTLPPQLVGRPSMEIQIEVNRTVRVPPDPRELGLVFRTFTIK